MSLPVQFRLFQIKGSEVILCCSGMSVDPDDVTPEGIRKSGAEVRFYGLSVLPGAMFLYAKSGNVHILGVPACVLHASSTAFDALFPIILTGEELTFAPLLLIISFSNVNNAIILFARLVSKILPGT